jgi:hypothetical protein
MHGTCHPVVPGGVLFDSVQFEYPKISLLGVGGGLRNHYVPSNGFED